MLFAKRNSAEVLFTVITVSRLGLTVGLVQSIGGPFEWSATWLMFVIAADIPNGIAARRFSADTNIRRIADSVVDRITVGAACTATALHRPEVAIALLPLAVRGTLVGIASVACWSLKNTIVTGGQIHKLGSLSMGAMGFVILAGVSYWQIAVVIATIISWIFFADYIPAYRVVLSGKRSPTLYRYCTRH